MMAFQQFLAMLLRYSELMSLEEKNLIPRIKSDFPENPQKDNNQKKPLIKLENASFTWGFKVKKEQ